MFDTLYFRKLNPSAIVPKTASEGDAGFDLCANNVKGELLQDLALPDGTSGFMIEAGQTAFIGTGLAIAIETGYFGAIYARSGLASKQGLRPANCVGVVDSSYRGEVIVALHNDSDKPRLIEPGERIAQIVFQPCILPKWTETDELSETERGAGGFGHTGTH